MWEGASCGVKISAQFIGNSGLVNFWGEISSHFSVGHTDDRWNLLYFRRRHLGLGAFRESPFITMQNHARIPLYRRITRLATSPHSVEAGFSPEQLECFIGLLVRD